MAEEDSICNSPLSFTALKLLPSISIETGVEKLVKSLFKTSKLNGGVNLSVVLPPAPPTVKTVPPDAFEAELAS